MVDVFGEVDEQIRSDRLRTFLQRAVPVFIGAMVAALVVVIGVWAYGQYQTNQAAKASQAYEDALDTEAKGDPAADAKAFDLFGAIAQGQGAYASLALMQQGGIRMDQGKPADAAALFDKAAASSKSPMISDIATLKAAYAVLDTAPLNQIVDRLTPLIKPDRPYHAQAREALALAKIGAGQIKDAKADLVALSLLSDTPDSLRQRAQAVIALIDAGTAGSLKSLAQQSLTAPPAQLAPPPQAGPPASPDSQSPDQAQGQPQGQPEAPQ